MILYPRHLKYWGGYIPGVPGAVDAYVPVLHTKMTNCVLCRALYVLPNSLTV